MPPLEKLLQTRCSEETRQRAELAATECELSLGEWIRLVIEGALEMHFDNSGLMEELDVPEPEDDPAEYIARIEEDAKGLRAAGEVGPASAAAVIHPGLHDGVPAGGATPPAQREPSPARTCPHMPQWVIGGRCKCGTRVVAGRRVG
jgi:hypothetical protein